MKTTLHRPAEEPISPPSSFRQFSMEDCVYADWFLNNGSDQFIQATDCREYIAKTTPTGWGSDK